MPLTSFLSSSTSPFDEIVEKATAEVLTSENWGFICEINDRVSQGGSKAAKDCLLSLKKRINHRDPHVILLALSVIDSCVVNCGKSFQQEVCSREFINELKSKATGSNLKIAERTRELIKRWSEEECKSDSSLSLMPSLYSELKRDGYEFPVSSMSKKSVESSTSSSIAALEAARREEEELNKAIQLSLKEQKNTNVGGSSSISSTTSLYPVAQFAAVNKNSQQDNNQQKRMVKALYDFEAAEDNELTFKTGEIISVLDDSDQNWWRGSNFRGEGLFPASFVTADLNADSAPIMSSNGDKKKSVQFDENVKVERIQVEKEEAKIDDAKLDRCLEVLQNADPTGARPDQPELLELEEQCLSMVHLIEQELGAVDKKTNQLAEVNLKLTDALNLYHSAMHSASLTNYSIGQPTNVPQQQPGSYVPQQQQMMSHQQQQQQNVYSMPQSSMNIVYPQ